MYVCTLYIMEVQLPLIIIYIEQHTKIFFSLQKITIVVTTNSKLIIVITINITSNYSYN